MTHLLDVSPVGLVKKRLLISGRGQVIEVDSSIADSASFLKKVEAAREFGFSLRSFLLYAQCGSAQRRSPGLFVDFGHVSFGLGLYERSHGIAAHIVAPQGTGWPQSVSLFSEYLLSERLVDRVYIRHLTRGSENCLPHAPFVEVRGAYAWCNGAVRSNSLI